MSKPQSQTQLVRPGAQRLITDVRDPRFIVDMGRDGIAYRAYEFVRLECGEDLYNIRFKPWKGYGDLKPDSKWAIWGSGCAKIVTALGGRLEPLPMTRDIQGNPRPGLRFETDPVSGVITHIEADAICAVRNPKTGEWAVAVATAYEDIKGMLLDQLSKVAGAEGSVRMLTERQKDRLEGLDEPWLIMPWDHGVWLAADLRAEGVRDILKKHREFANVKTLAPRIQSKAARHAFLANPVCRQFGAIQHKDLRWRGNAEQGWHSPYWDVLIPCWVAHQQRHEVTRVLDKLVTDGGFNASPVALLEDEQPALYDVPGDEVQHEFVYEEAGERQQQTRPPEHVPQVHGSAPPAQPDPVQAAPAREEPSPEKDRLIADIRDYEEMLSETIVEAHRGNLPDDLGGCTVEQLRAHLQALKDDPGI